MIRKVERLSVNGGMPDPRPRFVGCQLDSFPYFVVVIVATLFERDLSQAGLEPCDPLLKARTDSFTQRSQVRFTLFLLRLSRALSFSQYVSDIDSLRWFADYSHTGFTNIRCLTAHYFTATDDSHQPHQFPFQKFCGC